MNTDEANNFYNTYKDTLQQQYDSKVAALDQQRKNDYNGIMATANTGGMMYSNLPARNKVIYDTEKYNPAVAKARTTYQTGLEKIRQKAVDNQNLIRRYQLAIDDLNNDYYLGKLGTAY